jgi:hypothetical protein
LSTLISVSEHGDPIWKLQLYGLLVFFGNVVSQQSRGEVSITLGDGDIESIKKQIFQPIFQEFVNVAPFDSTPQIQ